MEEQNIGSISSVLEEIEVMPLPQNNNVFVGATSLTVTADWFSPNTVVSEKQNANNPVFGTHLREAQAIIKEWWQERK